MLLVQRARAAELAEEGRPLLAQGDTDEPLSGMSITQTRSLAAAVSAFVSSLPQRSARVVGPLLCFLRAVDDAQRVTKMDAANLATVLAPSFISQPDLAPEDAAAAMGADIALCTLLIQLYEAPPPPPWLLVGSAPSASSRQDESSLESLLSPEEITKRRWLCDVPMFDGLDGAFVGALAQALTTRSVAAWSVIITKGEIGDEMYFIQSGRCDVKLDLSQDAVASLHPGQFFGEQALLDDTPRNASIVATEAMVLYVLEKSQLTQVLMRFPEAEEIIRSPAGERAELVAKYQEGAELEQALPARAAAAGWAAQRIEMAAEIADLRQKVDVVRRSSVASAASGASSHHSTDLPEGTPPGGGGWGRATTAMRATTALRGSVAPAASGGFQVSLRLATQEDLDSKVCKPQHANTPRLLPLAVR